MKLESWIILIVVCAGITAGLGWYKYQQIQASIAFGASFPEAVEAVEAFTVIAENYQPTTRVTADVMAVRSVELRTELEGRIVEVGFAPGATVQQGDLLVRLDISEESAQLAAARADEALAQLALDRAEKLITRGAGTEEARDTARARLDATQAAVQRLQAVVTKRTLRAPFEARAGLHELEPGQFLDAGSLITHLVGATGDVWIDFSLPQTLAALPIGTTVTLLADSRVGGTTGLAEVIARDATVSDASRNVRFRALAPNADGALIAGMVISVEVPVGPPERVALVPSVSVRRDAFGASVYALVPAEEGARAPERAVRRSVEIGPERNGMTAIFSGIEPGERIAATGAFKLREGVLVGAASAGADSGPDADSEGES